MSDWLRGLFGIDVLMVTKANPYHEPAGSSTGGQFANKPGGGGGSASSRFSHSESELQDMEHNLKRAGVVVRDAGSYGHMIMPNGKGLAPVSERGISNHWEVAIDAGYLPEEQLKKLTHSPQAIVNGMLKRGWVRMNGPDAIEYWGSNKKAEAIVTSELFRQASSSISPWDVNDNQKIILDDVEFGIGYRFTRGDLVANDFDLRKTLRRAEQSRYQPAPPLEFNNIKRRKSIT